MAGEDEDFAALFEGTQAGSGGQRQQSPQRKLDVGKMVDGIVVAISEDAIYVDVGTRTEGVLDRASVTNDKGALTVAVGDKVRATVAEHPRPDAAPTLVKSLSGRTGIDVDALITASKSGTPVEGEFSRAVKAGIEVDIGGVRAFCPASQVEIGYTGSLDPFVGQRYFFRVLEVKDGGRSVIVSRRALLEAERAEQGSKLAQSLAEGDEREGIVQSVQPYGAFVDLGGLTGLVHVSELAHGRVASPGDVVSVGEKVRVQVVSVTQGTSGDPKDVRISLSMRALAQDTDTGDSAGGRRKEEIVTATVNKVESYGVLVDTEAGAGLVPNAEVAVPPGSDPRRVYSPGDTLQVVALGKDGSGRLRYSAKAVEDVEARRAYEQFSDKGRKGKGKGRSLGTLGDLLAAKLERSGD